MNKTDGICRTKKELLEWEKEHTKGKIYDLECEIEVRQKELSKLKSKLNNLKRRCKNGT